MADLKKLEKNWYAIYTLARMERKVEERLLADGYEAWLPLHRTPRVWSDRVKIVEVPLFNSYLFVRCEEYQLLPMLKTKGVVRAVYYLGKPAVVRQKDIDAIHEFLELAADRPLCTGEEVEILTGAMKHVSGKITRLEKKYVLLYLEQLGATICVNTEDVARVGRLK